MSDRIQKIRLPPPPPHQSVQELENTLFAVDRIGTGKIIRDSCSTDSPFTCIETLIVPALEEIGRRWEQGNVSLSRVYMSGRICETIVDTMIPNSDPSRSTYPRIAIAVLEDHHTLGKRIVYSVLRAGGYTVTDYGHGLTVDQLVTRCCAGPYPDPAHISTDIPCRTQDPGCNCRDQKGTPWYPGDCGWCPVPV